ncbi:MAG: hypothetical protein CVT64_09805 [Actinobacteria bacterium HGW-Actinobacteria-4]|nr:MAG: hypothetical protein CVT64_09805 [Actinobacteria bacterium HGW-Actinobacteria-4]
MDLDAFVAVREVRWTRLKQLQSRSRLTGAESDEFARLYQLTATDLSSIRSAAPDPAVISRLSVLLANSRASLAGAREPAWREIAGFFAYTLPAAFFRLRWWTMGVTAFFLIVAIGTGVHVSSSPEYLNTVAAYEVREEIAEESFASYYSKNPSTSFFARVWTNNSWVAAQSIAGGFTGVFTVYVQYLNAVHVGTIGAIMAEFGYLDIFFQLLLPHGMLELTAIWVAGAAGLKVFWTMLVPGPRPRIRALAEEGRSMVGVALGLVMVMLLAGVIEGYVTGSAMPWEVKNTIGVLALALFWTYVLVPGRRAHHAGYTGDVSEDYREDVVPVAA